MLGNGAPISQWHSPFLAYVAISEVDKLLKGGVIREHALVFCNFPYLTVVAFNGIRRMIYTTNTVEGYHRQIRKVTKNKGVFPNDTALEKLVYLAYRNIRKKWTMPLANWGTIAQQLAIKFGDRFKLL